MKNELQQKKWLEELQNSEAVQNYLNGFNAYSAKSFIEHYVQQKSSWHINPETNTQFNEKEDLRWIDSAFEHLEIILQKKLFDAQCLWRAEKLKFEAVQICADFDIWEQDVFNCPFIEPVNEDDIDLYTLFLQQNNVELNGWAEWQDYAEIKEAYKTNNANRDFPEWYDFHNGRTGNGTLMLLPDIRGGKEKFYCDLHFDKKRELNKEQDEEWEKNKDRRPWIESYNKETVSWFVSTFETKEVQAFYRDYSRRHRHIDEEMDIMEIIGDLLNADEYVPIEAHHDWQEALKRALNNYRCTKIAEALPMAFEQYQMNKQMGIAFPCRKTIFREARENWMKNILSGRKINGEPEDLDF